MVIITVVLLVVIIYIVYMLYFKEYVDVKKVFNTLEKVLDERDLLILKLLPEIRNKKITGKVAMLIDRRNKERKAGYTVKMYTDVELNKELKLLYEEINKYTTSNAIIKELFRKVISIEKILKDVREEYNCMIDKYNKNLINHKFVCIRLIRMKPLDKYKRN